MENIVRKFISAYKSEGLANTLAKSIEVLGYRVQNRSIRYPIIRYLGGACYPLPKEHSIFRFLHPVDSVPPDICEMKLEDRYFWYDRYLELKKFYGLNHLTFFLFYLRNGTPNTKYYGWRLDKKQREYFGGPDYTPSPADLFEAYNEVNFEIVNRLMLGYHRYDIARQYLNFTGNDPEDTRLLDYGCGVADPAVYIGTYGGDVTIVDLNTKLLEFAEWRLMQRDIEANVVGAEQTERPVDIDDDGFDFIVMSEFLEHVRNPMVFLRFAIEQLNIGGYLYDPVGRDYTHQVDTQHLKEAKEIVESDEYQQLHESNFSHINNDFYKYTP